MKNLFTLTLALFVGINLQAQKTGAQPPREVDFTFSEEGQGIRFKPVLPPLMQKAGAPTAYWACHWEFGDGSRSTEKSPVHAYAAAGDYEVYLAATAYYDDGKKITKKKKAKVAVKKKPAAMADVDKGCVFDPKEKQSVAMTSDSKARNGEELVLTLSYRNNGTFTTDGRLHLFFNERAYPSSHFEMLEARAHYGETPDQSFSSVLPTDLPPTADWALIRLSRSSTGASVWMPMADEPAFNITEDMLNESRRSYRTENAWRFTELAPGEQRNLFVSIAATEKMLKDTTATIHIEGLFAPFDPTLAAERFVMDIEIVASHDPNAIAVSDNRVDYRRIGNQKLDYKIQFQNNGEGPASTVEVKVEIPEGLNMKRMRPLDWHPKCPICPETPGENSCLDTSSAKDGLVFTFRNIYLPGSRQEGVEKRDSTKGFVKYRIEADKDMPKIPFRSRAKIVFDKNPPIFTNYTKTRFKPGISPGVKLGYNYDPDDAHGRYFFFGVSLSPYKSWRVYPQIELLTGIKSREFLPDQFTTRDSTEGPFRYKLDTLYTRERGFISFEIPVLLRKNFSRFFGAGVGGSARIIFESGQDCDHIDVTRTFIDPLPPAPPPEVLVDTVIIYPYAATRMNFTVFGDITFGMVRAGLNLGIRGGAAIVPRQRLRPFVQASLEMKF